MNTINIKNLQALFKKILKILTEKIPGEDIVGLFGQGCGL